MAIKSAKAEFLRQTIKAQPSLSNKEIIALAKKKRLEVTTSYVSVMRASLNGKTRTPKTEPSFKELTAAKRFLSTTGSRNRAYKVLRVYAALMPKGGFN